MKAYLLQTLMGGLGSVGFAMIFQIRKSKLIWIFFGGALSWMIYLLIYHACGNVFLSLLFGTTAAAFISELLARILKSPVTTLAVPMLIPLIPGGDLYTMMSNLVRGKTELFGHSAQLVMTEAGAIALGITIVSSVASALTSLQFRIKNRSNPE